MQQPKPLLSPKNDFVFKLIFGDTKNPDILIDFLTTILDLPSEEYEQIRLVDPHLLKENRTGKLGVLDIKVQTKNGHLIDIEIQTAEHRWLRERIVFYLSRMTAEQMREGEGYCNVRKSFIILITDFTFIYDNDDCHNRYQQVNKKNGSEFSRLQEINTLELTKADKKVEGTKLGDWILFFNAESEEELMEVAQRNPKIRRAVAIVKRLSEDERAQLIEESLEKARRDEEARFLTASMNGFEQGEARGMAKGMDAVIALLEKGLTLPEIRQRLGKS
jgi:predicted transposase/invertase (TIGR01784 family)